MDMQETHDNNNSDEIIDEYGLTCKLHIFKLIANLFLPMQFRGPSPNGK